METDVDRLGFVPRDRCWCECDGKPAPLWTWCDEYETWEEEFRGFGPVVEDDGYVTTCRCCRAELAVFDGQPYVRRAGFWRDVARYVASELSDARDGEVSPEIILRNAVGYTWR